MEKVGKRMMDSMIPVFWVLERVQNQVACWYIGGGSPMYSAPF